MKVRPITLGWRKPLTVHREYNGHDETGYIISIGELKSKGEFMSIDYYAKSVELLERIANSVHERDPKNPNLLCFSSSEVQLVEQWLKEFSENKPD